MEYKRPRETSSTQTTFGEVKDFRLKKSATQLSLWLTKESCIKSKPIADKRKLYKIKTYRKSTTVINNGTQRGTINENDKNKS